MNREQEEINKWFDSDDGRSCENPSFLADKKHQEFLRNRLLRAFSAGMSAGKAIREESMIGTFCKLFNLPRK